MSDARRQALEVVRETLGDSDLTWKEISEGVFTVDLPGEKKLCLLYTSPSPRDS